MSKTPILGKILKIVKGRLLFFYYITYSNHFDRPDIKATVGKIDNFSIVPRICPKYYYKQLICAKDSFREI